VSTKLETVQRYPLDLYRLRAIPFGGWLFAF